MQCHISFSEWVVLEFVLSHLVLLLLPLKRNRLIEKRHNANTGRSKYDEDEPRRLLLSATVDTTIATPCTFQLHTTSKSRFSVFCNPKHQIK